MAIPASIDLSNNLLCMKETFLHPSSQGVYLHIRPPRKRWTAGKDAYCWRTCNRRSTASFFSPHLEALLVKLLASVPKKKKVAVLPLSEQ